MEKKSITEEVIDAYNEQKEFDPLGSYTGNSEDGEGPVQDGDDL